MVTRRKAASQGGEQNVQTAFRLPSNLLKSIEAEAKMAKRTVSEEIRRRLESTSAMDSRLEASRRFIRAINHIDRAIVTDGDWSADPHLFAVYRNAVAALFARFEPKGEAVKSHPENYLLLTDEPPEIAGRMYANMAWAEVSKKEGQ